MLFIKKSQGMVNKEAVRKIVCMLVFFMAVLHAGIFFSVQPSQAAEEGERLLMATTTSTDNTGLLDYLMPFFMAESGINIRWVSSGTGMALKLGENCDVDVLLVHAPQAEQDFVDKGFGIDRREIMYNDFVLIGPPEDPAGSMGKRIAEALSAIGSSGNVFVSRGDNSGTSKKERALWKLAEVTMPEQEPWYRQSGQGMLATINVAGELKGYTLTDRGTYIKYESVADSRPALVILVEGDDVLLNQYSIIPVNPNHCTNVKYENAQVLSDWITGFEAQRLIGEFKLLDKKLFTSNTTRE